MKLRTAYYYTARATPAEDLKVYGYSFACPGCDSVHVIPTTGPNAWMFNGDVDRPTFEPSIIMRESQGWTDNGPMSTPRCHSFVRDGRIRYLADSTHALAGQTVELPEIDPSEAP